MVKPSPKVATKSKAVTANPKDLFGAVKVSMTKLPGVAILHASHAMMDGARKYGPYNWRDKAVFASVYIDAALRHMEAWFDREETAADSGVHHLGHAMGCMAILLDAQETGHLIDDRPNIPGTEAAVSRVLKRLNRAIKRRQGKK